MNWIDILANISSIIIIYTKSNSLAPIKSLRLIRILKNSKNFPGLNLVVVSLVKSGPMIIRLLLFAGSFILIMGLIPLKYLKGKMYKCVTIDENYTN